MKGKLYLIATPIGNLEDITLRAIRILKEVDIIVAEDTRQTLKLLNHLEISKPMISYHRHNEEFKVVNLIEKLNEGKNLGLVSDAGTPGISDPGEIIVKQAIENDIEIIPIPGACALISALISSGLNSKEFVFLGFLPLNKKLRKEKIEEIKNENKTMILYEAPHKLANTLSDLSKVLENRQIVLAREMTKIHEEFIRGTIAEIKEKCKNVKGEFVIIIEGNQTKENNKKSFLEDFSEMELYEIYKKQGIEKNEIIKKIAKDKKVSKNEIYQMFLNEK